MSAKCQLRMLIACFFPPLSAQFVRYGPVRWKLPDTRTDSAAPFGVGGAVDVDGGRYGRPVRHQESRVQAARLLALRLLDRGAPQLLLRAVHRRAHQNAGRLDKGKPKQPHVGNRLQIHLRHKGIG